MNNQNKIKVLIADDSFFMRKLLHKLLEKEDAIEVVGEAKDGHEVVELAKHLQPDVITMDYNMPKASGAFATREILSGEGALPAIIMLSAYTKEGAQETLESLQAGAVDFVAKPSGELSLDIEKVGYELVRKIMIAAKAHVRKFPEKRVIPKAVPAKKRILPVKREGVPPWLILIGASTGGPPVIEEILAGLKPEIEAAILVVQHMPPYFTKSFADRLNKFTPFPVREAADGDFVIEGHVLIAPGDFHMKLAKGQDSAYVVRLTKDPSIDGLRPAIDVLYESAAHTFRGGIIAVLLTGMGRDGLKGMQALKAIGAHIIAQDPRTSVVESMPGEIIHAGLTNAVLSPDKIPQHIFLHTKLHG